MTPAYLVKGSDDVLRATALRSLIDQLVAGGDRSLLVDEQSGPDFELGSAVDAAQTLPFLSDRRIVVIRHLSRFPRADDLRPLLDYLSDPLSTTTVVLVWERPPDAASKVAAGAVRLPAVPPALTKAVTAAGGEVVTADAPTGRDRAGWVSERLADGGIKVDGAARSRIVDSLGEDAGALVGLVQRLAGAYGAGASLSVDDVEPFLGDAGSVPPWELTDAIDRGDVAAALDRLARMVSSGGRHPLAIMATLQSHFTRMLRLDGADVGTEKQAAELLGLKGSTFPAKKALAQTQRLGHAKVVRAVRLLAEADIDLRGAKAWPEELVMEVLVARLARLATGAGRRATG